MSQEMKKAIELIEKAQNTQLSRENTGNMQAYMDMVAERYQLVDQALTKLKAKQPPASEFTKGLRQNVREFPDFPKHLQDLFERDILEACDIIDRSEASRKELLECLKELVDIIDSGSVMDSFTTQPARAAIATEKEGKE